MPQQKKYKKKQIACAQHENYRQNSQAPFGYMLVISSSSHSRQKTMQMMMTRDKPENRTSAVAALDEKARWRAVIHPGKRHSKFKRMQGGHGMPSSTQMNDISVVCFEDVVQILNLNTIGRWYPPAILCLRAAVHFPSLRSAPSCLHGHALLERKSQSRA
jgi:hypothetical protein